MEPLLRISNSQGSYFKTKPIDIHLASYLSESLEQFEVVLKAFQPSVCGVYFLENDELNNKQTKL
jgi:hypothetical protein